MGGLSQAPTFDRGELAADPKAAKLIRILMHYAKKLLDAERHLLARLSRFAPRRDGRDPPCSYFK